MSLDFEIILKIEITYEFAGGGWHYDTLFSRVPRRLLYKTHIYTHIYARYAREFQNMVSHVSLCHLYMNSLVTVLSEQGLIENPSEFFFLNFVEK